MAVANQEGRNGSKRVSLLLMQATISCMLVILLIAIALLLTLMGIRHIEKSYGTVRSSDQGKNCKALFETPDCRSLLLKQSLSLAIINGILFYFI